MLLLIVLALLETDELRAPQAHFWYDDLLVQGGHGRFDRERAAFLIRESNGTLSLAPWPHGGFRHASFRGRIPARTIAVLHTHPRRERHPSARDREEARRLQMPVVVITPEAVFAAMPDGREVTLRSAR